MATQYKSQHYSVGSADLGWRGMDSKYDDSERRMALGNKVALWHEGDGFEIDFEVPQYAGWSGAYNLNDIGIQVYCKVPGGSALLNHSGSVFNDANATNRHVKGVIQNTDLGWVEFLRFLAKKPSLNYRFKLSETETIVNSTCFGSSTTTRHHDSNLIIENSPIMGNAIRVINYGAIPRVTEEELNAEASLPQIASCPINRVFWRGMDSDPAEENASHMDLPVFDTQDLTNNTDPEYRYKEYPTSRQAVLLHRGDGPEFTVAQTGEYDTLIYAKVITGAAYIQLNHGAQNLGVHQLTQSGGIHVPNQPSEYGWRWYSLGRQSYIAERNVRLRLRENENGITVIPEDEEPTKQNIGNSDLAIARIVITEAIIGNPTPTPPELHFPYCSYLAAMTGPSDSFSTLKEAMGSITSDGRQYNPCFWCINGYGSQE